MKKLLKIALVLLPIFIIPISVNGVHINIRDARELLFESLVIVGLGIALKNKWLLVFMSWLVASWWFNFFLPIQSTPVLFNITFGFLLLYLIKTYTTEKDVDGILKIICWTVFFQVFWIGIQALGKDFIFHPITQHGDLMSGKVPLIGFLGNKNVLGCYLALCLPLFRVYYKKWIFIPLLGLVIAHSFMAFVSGLAGLVCYEVLVSLFKENIKRVIVIILICILLAAIFFFYIDKPGFERIEIWKKLIIQMKGWKILIGQGLGRFQSLRVVDKTGTVWDNPHNEYLQVYFELGAIGFLLLLGYLIDFFRRFRTYYSTNKEVALFSGIIVLLVNSLGMFPMQLAATAFLGIVYFGLMEMLL